MSVEGINFEGLSLCDALDLAILIEEEARDRYEELARQMELHRAHEAARFFRAMVDNESKHRDQLSVRRTALFQNAARIVTRAMLWDVEAPEYDEVRPNMTVRQALHVALRAEQKAHAFFVAALPQVPEGEVRALFEELREEEVEHQNLVNAELGKLPPGPDADPGDYEDEPVAH